MRKKYIKHDREILNRVSKRQNQIYLRKKIKIISSQRGMKVEKSKLLEVRENVNDKVAIV